MLAPANLALGIPAREVGDGYERPPAELVLPTHLPTYPRRELSVRRTIEVHGLLFGLGLVYGLIMVAWFIRIGLGVARSRSKVWWYGLLGLTVTLALLQISFSILNPHLAELIWTVLLCAGQPWLLARSRAAKRRPNPLVGKEAVVVRDSAHGLRVRLDDDVWNASSEYDVPLQVGETVVVRPSFAFSLLVGRGVVATS